MPLFFLISGFLFSLTNPEMKQACTGKFVWKKTKRLMVPYFVLGTIIFASKYALSGLSHAVRDFTVANFFKMFFIPGASYSTIGHLWYVFTLYAIFLLTLCFICSRLLSENKVKLCIVMIGLWLLRYLMPNVMILNISSILFYAPFFVLGILLQRNNQSLSKVFENRNGWYKCLIFFVLTIACLFIPVRGLYVQVIKAIIGILFSLSLCDFIIRKMPRVEDWMVRFSNKTYTIYLLSWFGHYMVKVVLVNVLNCHYLIVVGGMFMGGLLFPLAVCWLVDRVPLLNKKGLRLIIGY